MASSDNAAMGAKGVLRDRKPPCVTGLYDYNKTEFIK